MRREALDVLHHLIVRTGDPCVNLLLLQFRVRDDRLGMLCQTKTLIAVKASAVLVVEAQASAVLVVEAPVHVQQLQGEMQALMVSAK
jgi:hypothetical protein